jgi:hypothetical protein
MKSYTKEQQEIIDEFTQNYDIKPEQIHFEGASNEPIFDYTALNTLRWALTDIVETKPTINFFNERAGVVTVSCEITQDGLKASDLGSAKIGDLLPDGSIVNNITQAQNLATSRAFRRALRCAGIDLLKLHRERSTRSLSSSNKVLSESEKLRLRQKEIHALAQEAELIVGSDRQAYEGLIAKLFQGRTSSKDLNEIESSILTTYLRGVKYEKQSSRRQETKKT